MQVLGKSRKAQQAQALQKFWQAYGQAGTDVQFLLRASDLLPVYISSSFQQVLGVDPVRLEDDAYTLYRFLPDSDRHQLEQVLDAWDKRQPLHAEVTYLLPASAAGGVRNTADGAPAQKRLALTITPVLNGECYLVTLNDITASYQQIQALRTQLAATSEQAQERTDFLSQMSHEIRTPLNGI